MCVSWSLEAPSEDGVQVTSSGHAAVDLDERSQQLHGICVCSCAVSRRQPCRQRHCSATSWSCPNRAVGSICGAQSNSDRYGGAAGQMPKGGKLGKACCNAAQSCCAVWLAAAGSGTHVLGALPQRCQW